MCEFRRPSDQWSDENGSLSGTNCGATVLVEFGAYSGGPLAYDDFAKCPACGKRIFGRRQAMSGKKPVPQIASFGFPL